MPTQQPGHSAAHGSPTTRKRSLADELRSWAPSRLAALLAGRPDLAVPPPASIAALAERASQRASVGLAMDRLDAFTLQVLQALAVSPEPVTSRSTAELLGLAADDERVAEAITQLRDTALLWGPDEALRPLVNAREALGEHPVGLGPPLASALSVASPTWLQGVLARLGLPATADPVTAVAAIGALAADPPRMRAVLAGGPRGVEAVLEKLVWGPPFGKVGGGSPAAASGPESGPESPSGSESPASVSVSVSVSESASDSASAPGSRGVFDGDPVLERAHGVEVQGQGLHGSGEPAGPEAESPLDWLLARGLLGRWSEDTVVLPREIAFFLRRHVFGSGLHRDLAAEPPPLPVSVGDARAADEAAAAAAGALPRRVEEILESWSAAPPGVLRSGGVSVRDLRRTATVVNASEEETALLVEIAYAAGLVAADLGAGFWLPTPGYDRWLDQSPERRWAELAAAWLASDRCAGRIGEADDRNRAVAPLSAEAASWAVTELRRDLLAELAALPAGGTAPTEAVIDRLFWQRPRRSGPVARQLVAWTLREAVWLGVVAPVRSAAGVLSTQGRALLLGLPRETVAAALSAALPEPVEHVLIQGDLTAIAPGPLAPPVARELAQLADIESAGAATVYRFTSTSVRRAFDAGRAADDLHAFLAAHSLHAVPQALTYLIDDVARRHGRIRVGKTASYVRADTDAALAEMLADRRTAHWGLRRISPGVAVSDLPAEELLEALRACGYAPMAEHEDGTAAPAAGAMSAKVRRASAFHPYAPQRQATAGVDAVLGLAESLLVAG